MDWTYGDAATALREATGVLARRPSYDPRLRAAMVLGAIGRSTDAEVLGSELTRAHPDHTLINFVLWPIVRTSIEFGRRRFAGAIRALEVVAPFERGFVAALAPIYLRAQSHLAHGSGLLAIQEFRRLLDCRGSDPFSPFHAVGLVGLARAHAIVKEVPASLATYERFFDAWKEADPDVPILVAAREEYSHLREGRIRASNPSGAGRPRVFLGSIRTVRSRGSMSTYVSALTVT